jgi:hypothetical protein
MTTIVDALVVTLGLDPKNFKKGAADANKAVKDTEATVVKSAASMVTSFRRVATEFIGLFIAVRSVRDVVGFFENLNKATRQLGLDSKNFGIAANELRNWRNIVELAGGNAEDVTKTIGGLQQALFNLHYKGQFSEQLQFLTRLGVQVEDTTGKMVPFKNIMLQTAQIIERNGRAREESFQFLKAAGFDEGSINAILEGSAALKDYIAQQERLRPATKEQTEAAKRLDQAWKNLKQGLTASATELLTKAEPSIKKLFKTIGEGVDWINAHQDDINDWFTKILTWVTSTGATTLQNFFTDLATDIGTVAAAIRDVIAVLAALNTAGDNLGGAAFKALHERATVDKYGNRTDVGGPVNAGQYGTAMAAAEQRYGLPSGLLARVAKVESGFNPQAISSAGARGIMQLLPSSFPGVAVGKDANVDIDVAGRYLSGLIKQFGSVEAGLQAYNVGPAAYAHYLAHDINPKTGKPYALPLETQRYPQNVLGPAALPNPLYPNPTALDAARAQPTPSIVSSAPPIASLAAPGKSRSGTSVQIDSITVNTQARDANRIAADIDRAMQRKLLAGYAEAGLA